MAKNPLEDANNQKKIEHFLIEHAPLINMHATKLKNEGKIPESIDVSDLHVAGFHGLMDALHKYKPEAGASFATYAGRRIAGKMLDHVAESGVIPKTIMTQAKNIKALKPGQSE